MKQVLIASPISENFTAFLIEKNYELIHYDKNDLLSINNELIAGIITSNKLILSKTEIEKYPNLKWIGRIGSGMEIIDVIEVPMPTPLDTSGINMRLEGFERTNTEIKPTSQEIAALAASGEKIGY